MLPMRRYVAWSFPVKCEKLPTYSSADIEQLATGDLLALYNQLTGKSSAKLQSGIRAYSRLEQLEAGRALCSARCLSGG